MRKEIIGNATLYLGDSAKVLHGLRDGCQNVDVSVEQGGGAAIALPTRINAVITSPPYAQQRDYGAKITDWDAMMCGVFDNLPAADACQILVNLGQIHRDGEVICYWEKWREWMRSKGWRFFGQYIWDQGDGLPGNWNGRLAPSHEYVFHLKGGADPCSTKPYSAASRTTGQRQRRPTTRCTRSSASRSTRAR